MASSRGSLSDDIKQQSLVLDFCEGYIDLKYVKQLAKKLVENEDVCIEVLDISNAPSKMLKPIIQALASNTALKDLILYNSVTDKVVKWIVRAMRANTTLETLFLSGNRITCCSLVELLPLLDHKHLKYLMFGRDSFCCKRGDKLIAAAMEKNTGCHLSYDFCFEQLSDKTFKLLMTSRILTHLQFRAVDGRIAYEALKQRNDLQFLWLKEVLDLEPVADGLKITKSLATLWITHIDGGSPQGMRKLGRALSENVTLKSLFIDCYHHRIDIDAFLDGITVNTTLERLTLNFEVDDKEELEKRIRSKLQGLIKIEFQGFFLRKYF